MNKLTRKKLIRPLVMVAACSVFFFCILQTLLGAVAVVAHADDTASSTALVDSETSSKIDTLKQTISSHADEIKKLETEIADTH